MAEERTKNSATTLVSNDDPVSKLTGPYEDGGNSGTFQGEFAYALDKDKTLQVGVTGGVYTSHLDTDQLVLLPDERESVAQIDYSFAVAQVDRRGHSWKGARVTYTDSDTTGFPQEVQEAIHDLIGGRRPDHIFLSDDPIERWDVGVEYAKREVLMLGDYGNQPRPYIQHAASLGTAEQAVMAGVGVAGGNRDLPQQVYFANPERATATIVNPSGSWERGDVTYDMGVNGYAVKESATIYGNDPNRLTWMAYASGTVGLSENWALTSQVTYGDNPVVEEGISHGLPDDALTAGIKLTGKF